MKTLLTLLTYLFPSLSLGETMDDLVITSGLYYKKFTDVPFTGKVTGKEQGKIRNGKKVGRWKIYDKNGRIGSEVTYTNGKKTGSEVRYEYLENGQLHSKGNYKDGIPEDGVWKYYHENGQLEFKGHFKDGKKDGLWEHYWDNGKLRSKGHWKDGEPDGLWEHYWDNGKLRSKGHYKDGKLDGLWEYFYQDGTVYKEWTGTYKNDEKVSD